MTDRQVLALKVPMMTWSSCLGYPAGKAASSTVATGAVIYSGTFALLTSPLPSQLGGLLSVVPSKRSAGSGKGLVSKRRMWTHPGLLAVPVRLEEIRALLPVIVVPVQALHGRLRGILARAAPIR